MLPHAVSLLYTTLFISKIYITGSLLSFRSIRPGIYGTDAHPVPVRFFKHITHSLTFGNNPVFGDSISIDQHIAHGFGTLAGDDTAFLLMKDNTSADEFFHEIEKLL